MNKEFLQLIMVCLSPLLFSLGGFRWKWLRRYILPLLLGICLIIGSIPLIKAAGCVILLGVALCLPYGERTPYWAKLGVFCLYGLPSLIVGFSWWVVISPIVMLGLFKISNTKWGQNIVYHRIFEAVSGLFIGITYASII